MLTTIAAATDPAPTKMTARARATITAVAVRIAEGARTRAALEEVRRHEMDSRVLKVAERNSMSRRRTAARGGAAAPGQLGGGTTGTTTKSNQQFKGLKTLLINASIAADRGGNVRGVNLSKRCGYIKRGFVPGMDARTFNYVWLCWSFQANFMYSPVL